MVESDDEKMRIIGIVDIFGFEVFKLNSLEQLCINFANEKLQALFTKAVFLETIEAYKADGIDADAITYTDNATLIELFDAPKVRLSRDPTSPTFPSSHAPYPALRRWGCGRRCRRSASCRRGATRASPRSSTKRRRGRR